MIVIKGNLIIKQVRNSNNSESKFGIVTIPKASSEQINITSFADLDKIDISNATVLEGDITVNNISQPGIIYVTGDVTVEGGE